MTKDEALDYAPVPENFIDALKFDVAMRDAAPVQEPVAWLVEFENGEQELHFDKQSVGETQAPLYTTPPAAQRQWVGLTDAEVMQTMSGDWTSQFYFARAIEAKLKEKNT